MNVPRWTESATTVCCSAWELHGREQLSFYQGTLAGPLLIAQIPSELTAVKLPGASKCLLAFYCKAKVICFSAWLFQSPAAPLLLGIGNVRHKRHCS